jgi:hypothetical protein
MRVATEFGSGVVLWVFGVFAVWRLSFPLVSVYICSGRCIVVQLLTSYVEVFRPEMADGGYIHESGFLKLYYLHAGDNALGSSSSASQNIGTFISIVSTPI